MNTLTVSNLVENMKTVFRSLYTEYADLSYEEITHEYMQEASEWEPMPHDELPEIAAQIQTIATALVGLGVTPAEIRGMVPVVEGYDPVNLRIPITAHQSGLLDQYIETKHHYYSTTCEKEKAQWTSVLGVLAREIKRTGLSHAERQQAVNSEIIEPPLPIDEPPVNEDLAPEFECVGEYLDEGSLSAPLDVQIFADKGEVIEGPYPYGTYKRQDDGTFQHVPKTDDQDVPF